MTQLIDDSEAKQKDLFKKKRRNRIRLFLTWTISISGGFLVLGIIAGQILELPAFHQSDPVKKNIHDFIELLFTSCVGLLCLVLGFERITDFDNIETTLEKQNETLATQNKYFESSVNTLTELSQKIQTSSDNSKSLVYKVDELRSKMEPPNLLIDINWSQLIKYSDQIDFLVQGWDGWMDMNSRPLEDFFKRGGKFNLFVVNSIGTDASHVRELMKKRLNKSTQEVKFEITNTISRIRNLFDSVDDPSSKKELTVFNLNEVNWYFAAQFKSRNSTNRDALVLSLYSHHPYSLKETPAIMLYRDSAQRVFTWFDTELTKLKAHSAQ